MSADGAGISRISKVMIDLDQADAEAALARRRQFNVTLACGDDVASSYTLQLAVLTAASIGSRCFPGAVRTAISPKLAHAPLLLWPWRKITFGEAVLEILGVAAPDAGDGAAPRHALVFGEAPENKNALRVTFDGWTAKVGPAGVVPRLPEREYFSGAGILASSLALSQLFLSFAEISIEATRRVVALSLWRPDLYIDDARALGPEVEFLPRHLWVLGWDHLGNAYLWSLATLPYRDPDPVELALFDFDKVEKENVETGIILSTQFLNRFKTRACDAWLEQCGFRTRLVERHFDATFRRQEDEPALALCGFDSNPARRVLPAGQFRRIIDGGLGGQASNFDTISFHTWPNARPAEELWPDLDAKEKAKLAEHLERVAREHSGYARLDRDECGRRDLAGKSVAVPFVGTAAASLVVAEAVRLLHDGPAYFDIKLALGSPAKFFARPNGNYTPQDTAGLAFVGAGKPNGSTA